MGTKDNSFSSFCRRIMEEKGMSVSELSRRCGIPRTMVSAYMNGYYLPKKANRVKILEALGIDDDNRYMADVVELSNEIMSNGELKAYIEIMLHYYYVLPANERGRLIERAAELEILSKAGRKPNSSE